MAWAGITMSINVNINKISKNPTFFTGGVPKGITVGKGAQDTIEKLGKCSTPVNRLFLGGFSLLIQPFIDLNNKDVDEDTREISAARTAAKAIAGTATGVPIRALCIKAIDNMTCTDENAISKMSKSSAKWKTLCIPDNIPLEQFKNAERHLKKHKQAIGTIVALIVMLFTNFALDVPITKFLTNKFVDKIKEKKQEQSAAKGGN